MREGGELPEADEWTGGDMPAFSTSSLLSGDGDSAEHEGPPAPLILLSSLDYQYDTPGLGELVRPGPGRVLRGGDGGPPRDSAEGWGGGWGVPPRAGLGPPGFCLGRGRCDSGWVP